MKNALAIIGVLLGFLSLTPYLIDVIKKRTKPNIVSWITWTMLSGVATVAAFVAGQPKAASLTFAYTICTLTIVLLGLRYGTTKFSLFDGFCQLGAVCGLILWLIFDSPEIAIIAVVIIDFIGVLPTLRHGWLKPGEETWQSFALGSLAALLILLSLTKYDVAGLSYPLYLIFGDGIVAIAIIYRRKSLGISLARQDASEALSD